MYLNLGDLGIFGVLLFVILFAAGLVLQFLIIRAAVRAGIKEAYSDLAQYLRSMVTAGVKEAHAEIKRKEEKDG